MDMHDATVTKHEQLLHHIESLKPGTKISVRKLAKQLQVSEGTAYRAVKEAESVGLVITKERIGTVRVEKKPRNLSEQLTFTEVVDIVEGHVLGGLRGLSKTLNKYVIGAMKMDAMERYIDAGSLLIVGNREDAHRLALQHGAGVLITGGFGTSREVKMLADTLDLPIISSKHDTFTVASMINRALFDRLIKKKIMLVEDIVGSKAPVAIMRSYSTVEQFRKLQQETGHNRFPIVDEWNRVLGMIAYKDIAGAQQDQTIDKLYTRHPITASLTTTLASAAHTMVWEGIELLPVIDRNRKLIAVITRKEVLQAMRDARKEPQLGETFEDLIWNGFEELRNDDGMLYFQGVITPQMVNGLGAVSEGIILSIMANAALRAVKDMRVHDHIMENMTSYFVRPIQIEDIVILRPRFIEMSRKFCKLEIEMKLQDQLVAKAMMTAQSIDHD
ncbi:CBS domain-containing protein [Paenibacillus sp. ACRRX]|uniref:DRTGG domain-containing protein n=1 Tax=unclassified Paenibacillus TaxID=185978 RepID=UPI001EF6835D|nr:MULTISPECIES: DRTGG domain-containing protein [unclassified Paenibacillus]MCG7405845.1 CBS domain-containing protein [Paenibacillus sp. ACRRX]MDK8182292.1 DRTGG domain-containing protein [Paenibacillus sp. UMB4589-SE434]